MFQLKFIKRSSRCRFLAPMIFGFGGALFLIVLAATLCLSHLGQFGWYASILYAVPYVALAAGVPDPHGWIPTVPHARYVIAILVRAGLLWILVELPTLPDAPLWAKW